MRNTPPKVIFRNIAPDDQLRALAKEAALGLAGIALALTECQVLFEVTHRRRRKGHRERTRSGKKKSHRERSRSGKACYPLSV